MGGQPVGTIYFESDLGEVNEQLIQSAGVILAILLAAGLVALGRASRLQVTISGPIRHLAQTAKHVSNQNYCGARATKVSDDDLGQLTNTLNPKF